MLTMAYDVLDVRKYTQNRKTGVVDNALIVRIMDGLQRALSLQVDNADLNQFIPLHHAGYSDFILGPSSQLPVFDHILGPKERTKVIADVCTNNMAMSQYQKFINDGSTIALHCRMCCVS